MSVWHTATALFCALPTAALNFKDIDMSSGGTMLVNIGGNKRVISVR